jgi:(2Fe-2S) ferredoxin
MPEPEKEAQLASIAAKLGVGRYKRHILLCTGPNCCTAEEGQAAWEALKKELRERGLLEGDNACYRTRVGCLRICCHGPQALVYPEGTWYHNLSVDRIPQFVQQHLIEGKPLEDLVYAENPLPCPAAQEEPQEAADETSPPATE